MPVCGEQGLEVLQGPQVMGEQDYFVIKPVEELPEAPGLFVVLDARSAVKEIAQDVAVFEGEVVTFLHLSERRRGGKRAAAQLLLENHEREPVYARRRAPVGSVAVADEVRTILVKPPLRGGEDDLCGEHPPRREDEDGAPPVPDHHLLQESPQLSWVRRRPPVPAA